MRVRWIYILVAAAWLTACAGELKMEMDPALEANSNLYQTSSEGTFGDKRLNVSFGPYRVSDADAGWVKTSFSTDTEWLMKFFGLDAKEEIKSNISSSLSYKFWIGDAPWLVECALLAHKREVFIGKMTSSRTFSSKYVCRHTREGEALRVFSVEIGESGTIIRMEADGKAYTASPVKGVWEMEGGKSYDSLSYDAGYVWVPEGSQGQVGALSTMENKPRVWLSKGNTEDVNHALAMGSTALLIYSVQIKPSL